MESDDLEFVAKCTALDKAYEFDALQQLATNRLAQLPGDVAARTQLIRVHRRLGRPDAAQDILNQLGPDFQKASIKDQEMLIAEAEQLEDFQSFETFVSLASRDVRHGTHMLAAMAKVAFTHGSRHLATALYEADERTNWPRRFAGKNVLLSFPKSGTTWVQFGIAEYLRLAFGLPLEERTIEVGALLKKANASTNFVNAHDVGALSNERGDRLDANRVFLERVRVRYNKARVVLLVRDPRDTVVSHYHQLTQRNVASSDVGSMDEFVVHRTQGISRILAFYALMEELVGRSDVLVVYYEDLIADFSKGLDDILSFFGYASFGNAAHVTAATANAEFHTMRELERSGAIRGMRSFGSEDASLKVRKGKPGTFGEEVDPDRLNAAIAKAKRRPVSLLNRYGM